MSINYARIIDAALVLRAESPEGWDEFLMAMREYAAAQTAEILRCDPMMLQRAQGMAVAANELSTVLQSAPKLKERQYERSNPAGNQTG